MIIKDIRVDVDRDAKWVGMARNQTRTRPFKPETGLDSS